MPFFRTVPGISVEKYVEVPVLSGKKLIGWSPLTDRRTLSTFVKQIFSAPKIIREEINWFKRHRPTLIHLNSATLWTTAIAARRLGIPVVWHVRETLYGGDFSLRKRIYGQFILNYSKTVIAICSEDKRSLGKDREHKAIVVYNPIDLERLVKARTDVESVRTKLGLPTDAFLVLSLGGFSPRKGSWQIAKAIKQLPRRYHLVIAGGTLPNSGTSHVLNRFFWRLEDLAVRIGLIATHTWRYGERVKFETKPIAERLHQCGHVDDIAPLLNACDVLVFAGTIPHFARPIYEAWAMKKPVVAFDTPVLRAEISDGQDGFLVSRNSVADLAQKIREIVENPELALSLAENGQIKALDRMDTRRNVQSVLQIYRKHLKAES